MAVIRILQVFTTLNIGGAESMIMNYYRQLDKSKFQFDFLIHRPEKGAFEDEIIKLGGEIFRLDPINPFFPHNYYRDLRLFLKKNNYDIIHSHLNTFSSFPLKIANELNIPHRIAHAHTALPNTNFGNLLSKKGLIKTLKNLTKQQLKKNIHKYSNHQFSCGKKAGNWLFGDASTFLILNNAIKASKFTYNKNLSIKLKAKHNLNNDFVIGHIGSFTFPKNHMFLLEIFSEVIKLNNKSKLVLIGDGPLKNEIIKKAKDLSIFENIIFLGVRKDIAELCQILDAFVFPSFFEGLPVTLIEAQAAGLKIFASDSITKEVELTDDIQFLSIENKPEIWANKILENRSLKTNNLNQIISAGYDIKSNTIQLEAFYSNLLKK